jgi:hypothetical protein
VGGVDVERVTRVVAVAVWGRPTATLSRELYILAYKENIRNNHSAETTFLHPVHITLHMTKGVMKGGMTKDFTLSALSRELPILPCSIQLVCEQKMLRLPGALSLESSPVSDL